MKFLKKKSADDKKFGKPKKKDKDTSAKGKTRVDKGIVNLGRLTTRVVLIVCLITVGAAIGIQQLITLRADAAVVQQSKVASDSLAGLISAMMGQHAGVMEALSAEPQIAKALASGDDSVIAAEEKRLSRYFPGALAVRLIRAGLSDPITTTTPPISYACLATLAQAEKQQKVTRAEAHLPGSKQQHIDLAHRIMSPGQGADQVLGNLMVTLPVPMLSKLFSKTDLGGGYAELRQVADKSQAVTVVTTGNADLKSSEPDRVVPVSGTRWQLAYWSMPLSLSLLHPDQFPFWGIVIAAVVLITLVMLMFSRSLGGIIRNDLVSVINLVRDLASGRLKQQYPVRLHNFRGTIEVLLRMAHEFRGLSKMALSPAPTSDIVSSLAEEDEAEAAEQLAPDPMYQDKDAIMVEEMEDESGSRAPKSIFKAYDIRGIVGQTLTPDIACDIGRAIGSEAYERGQQSVIVARDGRLSGPELVDNLVKGMRETGRDVIDIGMVPTPVLYFATQYLNTGSGVMVTGSHNPPDYNGFKIVLRNETLSGATVQSLRQRIESENFLAGEGSLENVDVVADYIERITGDVKLARPLNIIIDCGNGVGGEVAPRLLRALGCDVTEMYCDIDGNFPNHHPDPSQPENLEDLIKAVREQKADIGLALDGDGDRLGVIDSKGNVIWPDRQMMMYAMDILSRNQGATIIYDVKCSAQLGDIIQQYGGTPLMWQTGHSLIKAKMAESGALLAGEMSGHIFFKERWYGFDDALYTAARLLEILAADERSSEKIFAKLPSMVSTPELKISLAEGQQFTFMDRLLKQAQLPGAVLTTIDGLRADFEDGWGLVRASNTTPCLVLRFEGKSPQSLKRIQNEFRRVLTEVDPGLSMPF